MPLILREKHHPHWGTGRGKVVNFCFHQETLDALDYLIQTMNCSQTEVVRQLILIGADQVKKEGLVDGAGEFNLPQDRPDF